MFFGQLLLAAFNLLHISPFQLFPTSFKWAVVFIPQREYIYLWRKSCLLMQLVYLSTGGKVQLGFWKGTTRPHYGENMFPSAGEKVPLSPSLVEKKQLGPSCIVVRYLPCKKRQLGPSCNVERWDSSAKMHDDGLETVHDHSFPCLHWCLSHGRTRSKS